MTFNVPQGWRVLSGSQNKANVTLYDAQSDAINVESAQRFGDETYQDEAKNIPRSLKSQHVTVTQQPDRTVNGVAGYVFSGSGSAYPFYYEFGTVSNDHVVTVVLAGGATTPAGRATAEADLESLLASIVWT